MKADNQKIIPKQYRAFSVTKWKEEEEFLEMIREPAFMWLGMVLFTGWIGELLCLDLPVLILFMVSLNLTILFEAILRSGKKERRWVTYLCIAIFSLAFCLLPFIKNGLRGFIYEAGKIMSKRGVRLPVQGMESSSVFERIMALIIILCWIFLLLRLCKKYMKVTMVVLPFTMLLMEMRLGNGRGAIWFFLCMMWILFPMVVSLRAYIFLILPVMVLTLIIMVCFGITDQGGWKNQWYHFRYGGKANVLPDGDLSMADHSARSQRKVLTVDGDNKGYYYLKGFVGASYRKNSWNNDDPLLDDFERGIVAGNDEFFCWLHEKGFSGWNELATKMNNEKECLITIRNQGASRKYLYLPYEMKSTIKQMEHEKIAVSSSGEALRATGIFGKKAYRIKMAPSFAGSEISASTKAAGSKNEYDAYEEYVNRAYLTIPKDVKETIRIALSDDKNKVYMDNMAAVVHIRKWLGKNVKYTEELDPKLVKEEFSEWFFKGEAQGYDVQYATAAVLLFRYYGIPSRYVEGYLVENTTTVTEMSAHAWPEIFLSGKGWVPVEVMDSYLKRMPSYLPENGETIKTSDKNVEEVEEETTTQK